MSILTAEELASKLGSVQVDFKEEEIAGENNKVEVSKENQGNYILKNIINRYTLLPNKKISRTY